MGASRPGMLLRGCASRTGFEVLNPTRLEITNGATRASFLFTGGGAGRLLKMLCDRPGHSPRFAGISGV
jgi:hypothetical protein